MSSAEGIDVSLWLGDCCLRTTWVGSRRVTVGSDPSCTMVVPTAKWESVVVVDDGGALSVPDGWSAWRVGRSRTLMLDRRDVVGSGERIVLRWQEAPRVRIELRRYRPLVLPRGPQRPLRRRPDALLAAAAVTLWASIVAAGGDGSGAPMDDEPQIEMTPLVQAMFEIDPNEPSRLARPEPSVTSVREANEAGEEDPIEAPVRPPKERPNDALARPRDQGGPAVVEIEAQTWPGDRGDPVGGEFTLDDAFAGDAALADRSRGSLSAVLETSHGTISCDLFEDRTPGTVANFVGLARGTRPFLDPEREVWRRGRLYDDTTFHRVVRSFVIQGGDPSGQGNGGPGYTFADEIVDGLRYDRPGRLGMANRGPDTNGSQFFITLGAFAHLDERHTIFGQCDLDTVRKIATVDVQSGVGNRPVRPVTLERVTITRR